ncbi:monovalent cation/H+ antiporter complex subunit F [Dehalococcoidia bacterium]|nr:monovalent cation/H+ antiporter complex subunit F [Dehalococcoidia bacterium]MCL0059370.1 monovalent cation/H+ antiporter complex subunit F [Dehalococcoidia bacterium]MCL0064074.1 monovalent cation/H+ antiporter complex subunit F [Dehalococcoidia bacterium]MCL0087513.1 monovalent cation/H+ antiporter complex subunit F [Dehalococcoidia bacterium]MCL0095143.1 monovalent cation/H+ antiporter complex subunit F [Dehalococcoidia bacterium]
MSVYLVIVLALCFTALLCTYRLISGPTLPDRIVAAQAITTKTLAILTLLAFMYEQMIFLDISLTYAVLAFLSVLAVARYLERGKVG